MLYKKYQNGTQKIVVPAGAEAQNGGVGMASMVDKFTGTPYGMVGDTLGFAAKELMGDDKAGSKKDVAARQAQAGLNAAGGAASVALNPAVLGATGGLSALAVPVAGLAGMALSGGAARRAEQTQLEAENYNKQADITNRLIGTETNYIEPDTTNTFGRSLYAKHGVRMGDNNSGMYQLTADFNGGPSHAEGGIKYIAPVKSGSATYLKPIEVEGGELEITAADGSKSIIPKNKAKKAREFLKKGDDLGLRTIIDSLPSEAQASRAGIPMYQFGGPVDPPVGTIETVYTEDPNVPPAYRGVLHAPTYQLREPEGPVEGAFDGMGGSAKFSGLNDGPVPGGGTGPGLGELVSTAGSALPTMYNLIKGGFGQAKTYQPDTVELDRLQYRDLSDPRRQAIRGASNLAAEQTRNYAFNAAQQGQNANLARMQGQQQLLGVDLGELARRDQIEQANVGLSNQEKLFNLSQLEKAQRMTDQAAANKTNYLEAGIGGSARLSDDLYTRGLNKTRDAKADAMQRESIGLFGPAYNYMYGDNGLGKTYLDNINKLLGPK